MQHDELVHTTQEMRVPYRRAAEVDQPVEVVVFAANGLRFAASATAELSRKSDKTTTK